MKTRFTLFVLLLLCFTGLNAQTGWIGEAGVPLKPQSPLFGKDILIKDSSIQNQRQVVICSAFNGWLYAGYSFFSTYWNSPAFEVFKSIDNGITWTKIIYAVGSPVYNDFLSFDMVTIGDTISNLKLFVSWVNSNGTLTPGQGYVDRFNGVTGEWEEIMLQVSFCYHMALSTDSDYPASNSNPHSLGVIYSCHNYINNIEDSIVFSSSSNGGISFDDRKVIAVSDSSFHKVALAYGRSPSSPTGRYFAAWEEKQDIGSTLGHIFTAHTEPNFNSPFTTPVQLDGLLPSTFNMCRNPKIACQYSNTDNDSANLTEVVLFEKYNSSGGDYNVMGFYNLQATTTSHFRPLNIATTSNNELQPDISFNPYNSQFMVTYFDSTTKKLPFLTNDVNLANPNSWNVVSQGYNDNSNLTAPYPKVRVNFSQQDGMNAWISEGTGGNGISLFDAPYSTYTGISGQSTGTSAKLIGAYPNPCSKTINIAFELKNPGKVIIDLMSIMGQPLGTVTDQIYPAGKHKVQYDVAELLPGNYLYTVRSGDFCATGKITVIR